MFDGAFWKKNNAQPANGRSSNGTIKNAEKAIFEEFEDQVKFILRF